MDRADIDVELVHRLIAEQFPHWADRRLRPVAHPGWDNVTFRLGDDLSVRLPSADGYVPQVDKEHRWLPVLAPHLPLAIPRPVARGRPSTAFPRPWSVHGWLPGEPVTAERVPDLDRLAADLAGFLRALYAIDATAGPPAGGHSCYRGAPPTHYDAETRATVRSLGRHIDTDGVLAVWDAGLATAWDRRPVWVHGDIAASNLLARDGRLRAVLDFGCSAVGDPACDLVVAWTLFDGSSRETFCAAIDLDDGTWGRARAWALWKALLVRANPDGRAGAEEHRMGWRTDAGSLVAELLSGA